MLGFFNMKSLEKRRFIANICFLLKMLIGLIDCLYLITKIDYSVASYQDAKSLFNIHLHHILIVGIVVPFLEYLETAIKKIV